MSYNIDSLNSAQRAAVTHKDGEPLLVIAGPGSGKTKTITSRAAHLIGSGVKPSRILLVTFTNKAAAEMRERMVSMVGDRARRVVSGTFHSVCARYMRTFGEGSLSGRTRGFCIYDDGQQEQLVRQAVASLELDKKMWNAQNVLGWIMRNKQTGASWTQMPDDTDLSLRKKEIWKFYESSLSRANAFDFEDLLCVACNVFESKSEDGERMRAAFDHVLVDEYQDTNQLQYRIVKALGGRTRNIFAVGDPNQSIYAFRGADYRNIREFSSDYPDASVIKLEMCYRSTKAIVEFCNGLASKLKQNSRTMVSGRESGRDVRISSFDDDEAEAKFVIGSIRESIDLGVSPNENAILYRNHVLSRPFEDALRDSGIRYNIVGGIRFYDRASVKNVMSYLRIACNPDSDADFQRVMNTPKRGLGDAVLGLLSKVSRQFGERSLYASIPRVLTEEKMRPAARKSLEEFRLKVEEMSKIAKDSRPGLAANKILLLSGLVESLGREADKRKNGGEPDKAEAAQNDLDNAWQVVNAVVAFENRTGDGATLEKYCEEVSLMNDADSVSKDAVNLMTIHASKGLEFANCYVVGLEENILPSNKDPDIDEELRLFYVACSRAKSSLSVSWSRYRLIYGNPVRGQISRFLPAEADSVYRHTPSFVPVVSRDMPDQFERQVRCQTQPLSHSSAD